MVKVKDYVAIDLEIDSKKYKLFRISTTKDGSLVVTPQIKPIIEESLKGSMDDIHISQHISGKNHIRLRNLKTKNYHIPSITQISNREGRWYICLNAKDKLPGDIFDLNKNKNTNYTGYYLANLSAFPKEWFTIYVEILNRKREKKPSKNLLSYKIYHKGFYIYISICSGKPEEKIRKRKQDLSLTPVTIQLQ